MGSILQCIPGLKQCFNSDEIVINTKHFRIQRVIGEGGYAFVYLAKDVTPGSDGAQYALKKILLQSKESSDGAQWEVACMQKLYHINLLPLLDYLRHPQGDTLSSNSAMFLLFPAFMSGTIWDLYSKHPPPILSSSSASTAAPYIPPLPLREIISIFIQIASGVTHIHKHNIAHADVKPHNILLQASNSLPQYRRFVRAGLGQYITDAGEAFADPRGAWREGYVWGENGDVCGVCVRWHAVLMDFGSCVNIPIEVQSRKDALKVMENAETQCSAPYRAPELYDTPSQTTIYNNIDTWSLGCTLYYMLCGMSPFEVMERKTGASLPLAIINGTISWTEQESSQYPQSVYDLLRATLTTDPKTRPTVSDIISQAIKILHACSGQRQDDATNGQ